MDDDVRFGFTHPIKPTQRQVEKTQMGTQILAKYEILLLACDESGRFWQQKCSRASWVSTRVPGNSRGTQGSSFACAPRLACARQPIGRRGPPTRPCMLVLPTGGWGRTGIAEQAPTAHRQAGDVVASQPAHTCQSRPAAPPLTGNAP